MLDKTKFKTSSNQKKTTSTSFIYWQKVFVIVFCIQLFTFKPCIGLNVFNKNDENNVDNNLIVNGLQDPNKRPHFVERIYNQTVVVGREATFQCVVGNLNKNQVAWFHLDKRAILAVQNQVVNNKKGRIRVSNHAQSSFYLHIKDVQLDDQGEYMCQINTEPMISQSAHLNVVVPPRFIEDRTSSDTDIKEGESVELRCAAESTPPPEIRWRREDNQQIQVRSGADLSSKKVNVVYGSYLNITRATKLDMGAYICIANNSIPAAISKRVFLGVNFPPLIFTPKTKIAAYAGDEVTLVCQIESYPVALYYWNKSNQMLVPSSLNSSSKYEIQYIKNTTVPYKGELQLKIRNLKPADFTSYVCSVSNYLGKTMGTISLTEIIRPSTPAPVTKPTTTYYPSQTRKPVRIIPPVYTLPVDQFGPIFGSSTPKSKIFDQPKTTIDEGNDYPNPTSDVDNDLIPWPINTSSSINLYDNKFLIFIILLIFLNFRSTFLYV